MTPPPFSPWRLLAGFLLSLAIGYGGYRRAALSRSGVLGAVLTGTLTFGLGGWGWGALLVAFFASSSALSRYRHGDKAAVAADFAKGGPRDLGQALANGGLGCLLALGHLLAPHPLWTAAFVGAMAAVNADTWGTEVGILWGRRVWLITTGRPVPPGTSGGLSWPGTLAALGGAAFIGGLAALFQGVGAAGASPAPGLLLAGGVVGGLAGALADSWLGATVQCIYFCPRCAKETERPLHHCGTRTQQVRGIRWLHNDGVNLAASAVGALAAGLLAAAALGGA
jgi:uncharacterized protein (TIGR00297 family)